MEQMPGPASWGREFNQLVQESTMKIEMAAAAAMLLAVAAVCGASTRDSKVLAAAQAARSAQLQLLEQVVNIDSGTGDVDGGRFIQTTGEPTGRALPMRRGASSRESTLSRSSMILTLRTSGRSSF